MSIEKGVLLFKDEVNKGVDPIPTASDAIWLNSLNINAAPEIVANDPLSQSKGAAKSLRGDSAINIEASLYLRGSGTAGTAPNVAALLKAAGLAETVSAGTKVSYAPTMTEQTGTGYSYKGGLFYKALATVTSFKMDASINQPLNSSFTLDAGFDVSATTVAEPTVAEPTVQPIVMTSVSAITSDGTGIKVASFSFDLGNNNTRDNTTGSNGFHISDFKPQITLTKDGLTAADRAKLEAATSVSIVAVFGTVAGNKITLTATNCDMVALAGSSRDDVITSDITYDCTKTNGNDNFTLEFL